MVKYVIGKVPSEYLRNAPKDEDVWYCHPAGLSHIPVFGSIGTKQKAMKICRQYNLDGKIHYE